MSIIDLSSLNLDELKTLQKDVEKAIRNYEKIRRAEALAAAEAKAKEMGFTLAELLGDKASSSIKRKINPPKYRHPENPEITWTGKGRQPAWIKEAIENGQSIDEFLIIRG